MARVLMKTWPAPAKINLFLHITRQRSDGYHELQTVFQFLDYCDFLQFQITEQAEIELAHSIEGISDADNLIVRAAKLLQSHANIKQGALISLDKKLPIASGLGGGSSNAATTLVALNQLWKCQLSKEELAQIGLNLGADVPIFVYGHAAWAEGVGEHFIAISPPEPWYMTIVPDCRVSTAEIFASPQLTRDCRSITISRFLSGEGSNVCEDVVKKNYPPVVAALDWLSHHGTPRMTGTGGCVFVDCDSQQQAQQILEKLPATWQGFIAKGCNESPLTQI